MSDKPKVETIEEFLARGGKITRVPPAPYTPDNMVRPTTRVNAALISLDEGAHFFSESKERRDKKKDELKKLALKLPFNIRKLFNL